MAEDLSCVGYLDAVVRLETMTNSVATTVTGHHTKPSGMYLGDLRHLTSPSHTLISTPPSLINNVYSIQTKVDLATYLHLCAWCPVVDTWTKAIDPGSFTAWPGLTIPIVRKHLPRLIPTAQGHLRLTRKNLRSTQPKVNPTLTPTVMTSERPLQEPHI